jgi:hypothetical protein
MGRLYCSSANFLMVFRDTPERISSRFAAIHSTMISFQDGCVAADLEDALVAAFFVAVFLAVTAFDDLWEDRVFADAGRGEEDGEVFEDIGGC